MPRLLLTDISVRALKPAAGQVDYWDTKASGFGIRVGARAKTFVAKVHNRRHTLGTYPAMALAEARRKSLALKAEGTPILLSKLTFEAAYDRFKADHVANKKERTQHDYTRVLDKYFRPKFAKTQLVKVTYAALTEITDQLADTPSEQAHALAVARTFFKWCARPPRRYIPHSPLEGLQLKIGKSRKRVLTDQELVAVWRAAEVQGYPHGYVIQTLILTGQRKSEIGGLCRSWLNEKERTVTLPDWITKNNTEHTFPFGDQLVRILENIPRSNSTDFFFPTRWASDRPFSGWSKYKTQLNDGCAHWTLHDLRRTFATKLAELRVPPHIVERLLNHKFGSIANQTSGGISAVAEVYNRWAYLPEMRDAIEKWEHHLRSLLAQLPTSVCADLAA
jgi:integrase